MNEDRKKIAIMDWDDQFELAEILLGILQEEFNFTITDEQEDFFIEAVIDLTDEFSTGESIHD